MSNEHHDQGGAVGVGGAVVRGRAVLLVRRGAGAWRLPAAAARAQTLDEAAVRGVLESAGVHASVQGVLAVHSRWDGASGPCVVFLMRCERGEPAPGADVDRAEFLTLEDIDAHAPTPDLVRAIAARALDASRNLLLPASVESSPAAASRLFLG